jgi:hypothetical protein
LQQAIRDDRRRINEYENFYMRQIDVLEADDTLNAEMKQSRKQSVMMEFEVVMNRLRQDANANIQKKDIEEKRRQSMDMIMMQAESMEMMRDSYQSTRRNSIDTINTTNSTVSVKSIDYHDKKVAKVLAIFNEVFKPCVLYIVKDEIDAQDLAAAWTILNKTYMDLLSDSVQDLLTALGMYKIKPSQQFRTFVWCVEVMYEVCAELNNTPIVEENLFRVVRNGIEKDHRFKMICISYNTSMKTMTYKEFKQLAIQMESDETKLR